VGQHGSASGSILLGLDGFEVTAAVIIDDEWRLAVQTTATTVGCVACGTQARLHARRTVGVRDFPIGGRPVVLAWRKRVWRCVEPACAVRTWTEQRVAIRPRAVLTCRARAPGVPAGRQGRPRGRGGRPGPGGRLGDSDAGGARPRHPAGRGSCPAGRCDHARVARDQLSQSHPHRTDPLCHRAGRPCRRPAA
jgi:hypothetical protein